MTNHYFSDPQPLSLAPDFPLYPATITSSRGQSDRITAVFSSTPFPPSVQHQDTSLWSPSAVPNSLSTTPAFYQRLIGPLPEMSESVQLSLAHGLELETLAACSDGSVTTGKGSHG